MNISVIIPVYNVEKYVERCILSIMSQTYTESVECIVVNDCTPDNSMKIVEKMVSDYKGQIQFKLLYHEHNRGVAAVRNTGLDAASGDYIIQIDSDDYCEPDMLEKMYAKAVEEDADIVVADYWRSGADRELYCTNIVSATKISRIKDFLQNKRQGYLWCQLIRRLLLVDHHIKLDEGIDFAEDFNLSCKMYCYAENVAYIPKAFVHYVQYNMSSYVKSMGRKSLENIIQGEKAIMNFFEEKGMHKEVYEDLLMWRISHFVILLFRSEGKLQRYIISLYSDIPPFIKQKYLTVSRKSSFYWLVAHFFASLRILFIYNLMRAFWKTLKKKQAQQISFFSE